MNITELLIITLDLETGEVRIHSRNPDHGYISLTGLKYTVIRKFILRLIRDKVNKHLTWLDEGGEDA